MDKLAFQVLDFFHDEENSSALTILEHNTRFHIIADIDNLKTDKSGETDRSRIVSEKYLQLLHKFKASSNDVENGIPQTSTDSGVDLGTTNPRDSKLHSSQEIDAEASLYQWLVSPIETKIHENINSRGVSGPTLEDWYNLPTRHFNLHAGDAKLQAVELEAAPDLEQRMSKLRPRLTPVPKYILSIDTPWYAASDLQLVDCTNSPPPYHPSIVELQAPVSADEDGEPHRLFFKTVDNSNPQPTKREISLLQQIAEKGLHDKIRCPRLKGIVSKGDSSQEIMGFLQTLIPDPTPLTEKLDSSIPQDRRERWAREADRMKTILHEHGIVWGDAKGDNFMVDSSDNLWIIDFGGSYTEGWVDPEIAETNEGDDMGVAKVVNALNDPDENVEGRGHDNEDQESDDVSGKKRKRAGEGRNSHLKRQKKVRWDTNSTSEAPRYCYCGGLSSGTMIGCDGSDCEMEWFHIECTSLTKVPVDEEAWFCRDCESVM